MEDLTQSTREVNRPSLEEIEKNALMVLSPVSYVFLLENAKIDNELAKLGKSAKDFFTQDLFKNLGGVDSEILKNTLKVEIKKGADTVDTFLSLNPSIISLIRSIQLTPYEKDGMQLYKVSLYNEEMKKVQETMSVHAKELQQNLTSKLDSFKKVAKETVLKAKEQFKRVAEHEIPKELLKQIGIKWKDLSVTKQVRLLTGKPVDDVRYTVQEKGKSIDKVGTLSFKRDENNSVKLDLSSFPQFSQKQGIRIK